MYSVRDQLASELDEIRDAGLFKAERVIASPQQANVRVGDGEVLNFCANNYLGLADHPALIAGRAGGAGPLGLRDGVACASSAARRRSTRSSRRSSASFLGTEDTILYGSCFDANGGLFETLLGPEDAVITDALNHASIIDGVRLCKAQRHRYANSDMDELEALLQADAGARRRLIATDGVFSMDGYIAKLDRDLRPRRALRRDGHGRRLARGRLRGRERPRHARAVRRDGPRRHHHRHARQGARRRVRRLHQRPPGDRRAAAPALAARTCSPTRSRRRSWPPR